MLFWRTGVNMTSQPVDLNAPASHAAMITDASEQNTQAPTAPAPPTPRSRVLPRIYLPIVSSAIPAELRDRPQWVNWRFEHVKPSATNPDPKPTKIPVIAGSSSNASPTDASTWRSFDAAWRAAAESRGRLGVGFVFSGDDSFCGIDLDDCIDEHGTTHPDAAALVATFASYAELSPSGKGIKVIIRGKKPSFARCSRENASGCRRIEVYDSARFFTITGNQLAGTPNQIAEAQSALTDLCERLWPKPAASQNHSSEPITTTSMLPMDDRERRCTNYITECPDAISGKGGHNATLRAACECFRFGLDEPAAWRVMTWFNTNKTGGEQWSERELAHKIESARAKVEADGEVGMRLHAGRGRVSNERSDVPEWPSPLAGSQNQDGSQSDAAEQAAPEPDDADPPDQPGLVPLGQHDPKTGRLVLSPKRTLPTAKAFVRQFHSHPDGITIRSYGGLLLEWKHNRYVQIEDESVKNRLFPWLHRSARYVMKRDGSFELVDFEANPHTVAQALDSIRTHTHLPANHTSPSWLVQADDHPPALELLPCKSMTLHIPTGRALEPTPLLFNTNALEFDYDPDAPTPTRWLGFIHELFADDQEAIELLQEWFGYSLTGDTRQQKMLLLVGPKRSGKGTIGRVLTRLVGQGNVVGPTTGSLAGAFGLQPLLDKSLAIVSDARFSGENVATVVERLLCISGEDTLSIDRKFLGSVSMKLPTRFMFLTNELPRLSDASNALAGRFMILKLRTSFFGKEDTGLSEALFEELPGILLWAIEGWKRLNARGRFVQPESSREAMQDLEDLASPVGAFLRERCVVGPGHRVGVAQLFQAWQDWCSSDGRTIIPTKQTFGRDLSAAEPGITCRRGTFERFYEGVGLATPF